MSFRGRVLEQAVRGCRAFAGDAWSAEDVERFAGLLARLEPAGRASYRVQAEDGRCAAALREIAKRAQTIGS